MVDTVIIEQAKTYKITRAFGEIVDVLEVKYQFFEAIFETKS